MFSLNFSDLWLDGAEYLKSNLTSKISSILALLVVVIVAVYRRRRGLGTPRLQGPRSESFIFGKSKTVFPSTKLSVVYRDWERTYGPVYEIPTGFGSKEVILGDLKALIHLFSKDTTTYYQPARVKAVTRKTVRVFAQEHFFAQPSSILPASQLGDILIMTEGETHKKLRRNLSHPLSVSAIRNLTRMCLDSAYQLKAGWDSRFQPSNDAVVINIEKGMSHVALDSAGKAILSHDFGALRGKKSPLLAEVDAFHAVKPSPFIRLVFFTVEKLYSLFNVSLPNTTERQFKELATLFKALTTDFLAKAREAPEDSDVHQSVLGVFLRSENADSKIRLSLHEIMTQVRVVLWLGA
ncbi:hypothetical protein APHAL10511_000472 [Amanita phalloides]|nr:hypothetical protein APHAL10511_000472 [Amanita phalloides]